jgi:hypothetical protein
LIDAGVRRRLSRVFEKNGPFQKPGDGCRSGQVPTRAVGQFDQARVTARETNLLEGHENGIDQLHAAIPVAIFCDGFGQYLFPLVLIFEYGDPSGI